MRDTQRDRERQRHRQREKQAPCREPDVGLDPWSPGSHPELQAALNCCTTRAALIPILEVHKPKLGGSQCLGEAHTEGAGFKPRAYTF